jgi:hypothetical protein
MESRSFRRRTIALIAGYAVALQALFSAFVPFDPAALSDPLAVLCTHDDTGGASHPASHDLPCAAVCAALGHGIAGPVPPEVVIARTRPVAVAAPIPVSDWVTPHRHAETPHAPRGPPLA